MILYVCNKCGLEMVERPTRKKGRCGCGHKLYPNGYHEERIASRPLCTYYPYPSWEEDLK